jgi:hypothetical protein
MQRVLIAYRNDNGRHLADRLRGALDSSQRVFCLDLAELPDDRLNTVIDEIDRLLVVVDEDWNTEGLRALDDEPGRRLVILLQAALGARIRIMAVLPDEVRLPGADVLPEEIGRFSVVQEFSLSDERWAEDLAELVDEVSAAPPVPVSEVRELGSRQILITAGLVGLVVLIGGLLVASRFWADAPSVVGKWVAEVDYGRGVVREERFEFRQSAGDITGNASWHGARRVIEGAQIEGDSVSFHIRTHETLGSERRELRHEYAGIVLERDRIDFTLRTSGSFSERPQVRFEARRTE